MTDNNLCVAVEGVATVITDTDRYKHLRKEIVAAVTCAIGFLVSITFATDIGALHFTLIIEREKTIFCSYVLTMHGTLSAETAPTMSNDHGGLWKYMAHSSVCPWLTFQYSSSFCVSASNSKAA